MKLVILKNLKMATPESKTKKIIEKYLKKYNLYYFMPAQGAYSKKGVPDFIICYDGRFLSIEAKKDGYKDKDVTELQKLTHEKIRNTNGIAIVISNEEEMKQFEELYLKEIDK